MAEKILNMDFSQRIVIDTLTSEHWFIKPNDPLRRIRLEYNPHKQADVTSIVEYPSGSHFTAHQHPGGEEIFVLDGVFQDEHGSYPSGSYLRNPIGSAHTPYSNDGCKILVKLGRFHQDDTKQIAVQTKKKEWRPGLMPGLSVMSLHEYQNEHTALVKWKPNTKFNLHQHWGGEEIFVLDGVFYDEHGTYSQGTWIRSPHLAQHQPYTKEEGAIIFVKTGHLF